MGADEMSELPPGFVLDAPAGQPALPPGFVVDGPPSTLEDVAKSAGVGLGKGAIGVAGAPADLRELAASGAKWAFDKLGMDKASGALSALQKIGGEGATSNRIQKEVVEPVTGEFYKPQTRAGRYAETIGEFAPSSLIGGGSIPLKFAKFAALPGAASEFAGEQTKGTDVEPYARVAAALTAPFIPGMARKAITPFESSTRQREMVDLLNDRGVTSLTAGQKTGSPVLQALESKIGNTPGSGFKADAIAGEGEKQFTQSVMRDVGESGMATKPELQIARERIGDNFNDLSARNDLKADIDLTKDMNAVSKRYGDVLDANQKPIFDKLFNNIYEKTLAGGMSGEEYQIARSQLGGKARGLQVSDPESAKAFKGLQKALDSAMERGLSPDDKVAWRKARDEYGRLKDIEGSVAKTGDKLVEGIIEPAALNRAISSGKDASAAARGQLPFSDIAEAGAGVMKSPERASINSPTLSGLAMGIPNAAAGRLAMSGAGQKYLGNQLITGPRAGNPAFAAILNSLLSQQQNR